MEEIAPMLQTLGYDPNGYPPNYGEPDKQVLANSELLDEEPYTNGSKFPVMTENEKLQFNGDSVHGKARVDNVNSRNPRL